MLIKNVFILFLIEIALCDFSLGTSLENSTKYFVVEVGTNVSIECRIEFKNLLFDFVAVNNVTPVRIFLNGEIVQPVRSRYRINKRTNGQCDFLIDFIDRRDAGKYLCRSFHSTVHHHPAYLTVIDSDPVCESNSSLSPAVENDKIFLACKVNSTGFMIPSMKWTKNNNVIKTTTVKNVTTNGAITTTSSTALQLQPQDNNVTIECTTSFHWPNGSQENIPEYKHVWTHIATVLYGARNITIQPNTSNFQYGQQLMCFADGNPEPSYNWTHINTNRTWNGSVLTLEDSLPSTIDHVLQCTAQNIVEGKRKTVSKSLSFYINVRESGGTLHFGGWIAFAIGGSAFIIVVLLLIFCIFCPNKAKTWLIIRFSSLQRKLNPNPDVLPRESSSRAEYVGGSLYASPYSYMSAETNDRPVFEISDVPLYSEVKGTIKGFNNDSYAHGSHENDALTTDVPRRPNRKENSAADDDTVYVNLTGAAPDGRTDRPFRSPAFTQVAEYASIDHTRRVPSPPRKY